MKTPVLKILLAFMCVVIPVAMCLIPDPAKTYVSLFCPALFFTMLSAILSGPLHAFFVGALIPLFSFLLFGGKTWIPEALSEMISFAVCGLITGLVFNLIRNPFYAVILGILTGRLALGITKALAAFLMKGSYSLYGFLDDALFSVWPGILAAIAVIPVITIVFRKTGILYVLQRERTM